MGLKVVCETPYAVRNFDLMDNGDPTVPPTFSCEQCGGQMYPVHYESVHGYEHKLPVFPIFLL
jgi:hypothetical protein